MNDDRHAFSSLPEIDAVDVVLLSDSLLYAKAPEGIDSMHEWILGAADRPCVRVEGVQALQIATLWRRLSSGEEDRCHIPPFGLRFHAGGNLILQVSVCWGCNNIYGYRGDRKIHLRFEATSSDARELLSLLKQVTRGLSISAKQ
jgi:hypothetical protein